ncbi:MAG: LysE family translocator [Arenicellales bacterium]
MIIEILQFLGITLLLEVTPGPAVLFVMFQSAKFGLKHAFAGILGLATANVIWIVSVASGLGLLMQSSPNFYNALKYVGVLYLLYLGGKILFKGIAVPEAEKIAASKSVLKVYLQGIFTSLTNPKALLFFLALFPQFAREDHFTEDMIFWGTLKIISLVSVMGLYAVAGNAVFRSIKNNRAADVISRLFGLGIMGAALGVALH